MAALFCTASATCILTSLRASSFGGDASSFKLAGVPSWAGPARASGAGINGDPFNTSADESFDAFAGLRGAAATFKPDSNGQQSAKMTSLTYNSFVDDGPTIVTSAPAARITFQEPIGTKSGSSTSPVRAKVFFTTDVNPNKPQMGGRFLLVEGLADKDLADHGIISIIDRQVSILTLLHPAVSFRSRFRRSSPRPSAVPSSSSPSVTVSITPGSSS